MIKDQKIKLNSQELYYKEFLSDEKKAKNILILHGWGGKSDSWVNFSEKLIEHCKLNIEHGINLFIPDLPGHGKSLINKIFTIDDYTEIIEEFCKKLNLKDIILLGHSNGGAISMKLTLRKNIDIKKLVLNNSAGIRNNQKRSIKRKIFNTLVKPLKLITKITGGKKIRELFYKAIGGHDYLEAEKNPFLKETYINMIKSDLQDEMKKIDHKNISLIRGENDTYTPLSDGKRINSLIKGSKLTILDGEKHGIHIFNPERLALEIVKTIR